MLIEAKEIVVLRAIWAVEGRGPAQEISEWNNISVCARDHSAFCDILSKNVSVFCSHPKNLLEGTFKSK